ncbi:aldo/keto reductase [Novipirellula artificiosorum]|uniref:Putative aldo-keto reductase n=1 Tax=Novipirellula artificiosorum TaxID=2528016 RepID=A0A5C6CVZ5_9BACT|nr:aldo/keto reductase [Novipirellula artificiosorum]TWU28015.1 putative aldo-keto reductase [Novipirellula artificiosorum]
MQSKNNTRRDFIQKATATTLGLAVAPAALSKAEATRPAPKAAKPEWRNKQDGMSYRMLGRTGFMVSELVSGTFPYNDPKHFPILDAQIGHGINYIDTASAYSQGGVESNIGTYLKESNNRDKVFLSTKLSGYYGFLAGAIGELQKELPESKVKAIRKKVDDLMAERGVLKPGYHMNYFGGQEEQIPKGYFNHLMLQEYGYKSGWRMKIKDHARKLLEDGLTRLQTDHLDVLHCPHGITMPDLMEDALLPELFEEFKQKGLIRAAAVSFHNDVGANLAKAIEVGYYDAAMFAYNIANHASTEPLMLKAKESGLGTIAMKVARLFAMEQKHDWRRQKLEATIPDKEIGLFPKTYLWALQNPNLSCCVAQMENVDQVKENVAIVGRKVELLPV